MKAETQRNILEELRVVQECQRNVASAMGTLVDLTKLLDGQDTVVLVLAAQMLTPVVDAIAALQKSVSRLASVLVYIVEDP